MLAVVPWAPFQRPYPLPNRPYAKVIAEPFPPGKKTYYRERHEISLREFDRQSPGQKETLKIGSPITVSAQAGPRGPVYTGLRVIAADATARELILRDIDDAVARAIDETKLRNDAARSANKPIEDQIGKLECSEREAYTASHAVRRDLAQRVAYIKANIDVQAADLDVKKSRILPSNRDWGLYGIREGREQLPHLERSAFYSLWASDSPVFQLMNGKLVYAYTSRKDGTFELKSVSLNWLFNENTQKLAAEYHGLTEGTFWDGRGHRLSTRQADIASKFFEHINAGTEVLPAGPWYRLRERRGGHHGGQSRPIEPRTWGQDYLKRKGPNDTRDTPLRGSGGSYQVFVFGNKTLAEFDEERHATYCFDTNYFEGLRVFNRAYHIEKRPEGFHGRIVHKTVGGWKQAIDDYLADWPEASQADTGQKP
jgi:hypothetical protein